MTNSSMPEKQSAVSSVLEISKVIVEAIDPISILIIGAGGTGSLIATNIARMEGVLRAVHNKRLSITIMDDDVVTEFNIGRQLFSPSDIGLHKAAVLATRINRFFGVNWTSELERFNETYRLGHNIVITATDNVKSRELVAKDFYRTSNEIRNNVHKNLYWIDCGNGLDFGNVILADSKHKLANIFNMNLVMNEEESGPSCSLAEAIGRQDMFVNSWVAMIASQLLWELLTKRLLTWHAAFFNLQTLSVAKRKIQINESKARPKKRSKPANRPANAI